MKNCYQLVALLKTLVTSIGFFLGMGTANTINKKYYNNTIEDFTGLKAYLMYRYWEANQITDLV